MKLKIDENGVIIITATDGVNVPPGIPLPIRLERFVVVNDAIELNPDYLDKTNDELDIAIAAKADEELLELERTALQNFADSKKSSKIVSAMRSVDSVTEIDNAGYLIALACEKRVYDLAGSAGGSFILAAQIAGVTEAEYRTSVVADYETKRAKKDELMDLINGVDIYITNKITNATTMEELSAIRTKINILSELDLGNANISNISSYLT